MGLYDGFVRDNYPDLTVEEMADKMISEGLTDGEPLSVKQCLRRAIRAVGKKTKRKSDDDGRTNNWREPGEDWYKKEDEWCLFSIAKTPFKMRCLEVEKLIQGYVNAGAGMTTDQLVVYMGRHFDRELTPDFAARILRVLGITHKSPPLAPWEVDNLDEDEAAEKWFNIKMAGIDQKYRQKRPRKMMRELKKERAKTLEAEELVRGIFDALDDRKDEFAMKVESRTVEFENGVQSHTPVLVLADWHAGKIIDLDINQYNKDVFWENLFKLEREICEYFQFSDNRPVDKVRILIPGDMVDGVLGNMHDQQQLGQDLHGLAQSATAAWGMAYIARAVSEMCGAEVIVDTTGGNHGRTASHRNFDRNRFAENVTYLLAKLLCHSDPNIHWNIHESDVVVPIQDGRTKILLTHGDRSPKRLRDLLWMYRKDADYFVVVSGHLHSLDVEEDMDAFLIRAGSFCGADEYAVERLGKGAKASQVIFSIREGGPRPGHYLPLR